MNIAIRSPGRLSNQLIMLYHAYTYHSGIERVYAPRFEEYRSYFNIDGEGVLCDQFFYEVNLESFKDVFWGGPAPVLPMEPNLYDDKYKGLKLKKPFEDKASAILKSFGDVPLISVHIRHGDYKEFCDGLMFFSVEQYVHTARRKVEDWGLTSYKILFFSDSVLPDIPEGVVVSRFTENEAPVDLFLMAQCNYFIYTWSTFSLLAMALSKSLGKYKDSKLMEREA